MKDSKKIYLLLSPIILIVIIRSFFVLLNPDSVESGEILARLFIMPYSIVALVYCGFKAFK